MLFFIIVYLLLILCVVDCEFEPYKDNSGTVVGIAGKSFVLLAADSRLFEQVTPKQIQRLINKPYTFFISPVYHSF